MSEWSKHWLVLTSTVARFGGGTTCAGEFQQTNGVVGLSVAYYYSECLITREKKYNRSAQTCKMLYCIFIYFFLQKRRDSVNFANDVNNFVLHLSGCFHINLR